MRILLLNPNTSADITALLLMHAQAAAEPGTAFTPVTAAFGARYIGSRAAAAIAGHAALELVAQHARGYDAVILGCFGDPGMAALREVCACPVIGLAEASMLAAMAVGARFGILTGGATWVPMLEELVAQLGFRSRLAAVRAVAATGAAIAADPDRALDELAAAATTLASVDGADVVILGGAGLAGIAPRLEQRVPVPLLDCIVAGVQQAELAVSLTRAATRLPATPAPVPTVGLGPDLARLLSGEPPPARAVPVAK